MSRDRKRFLTAILTVFFCAAACAAYAAEVPYELEWVRQLGTSGYDWSSSVAIDGSGNAYISGETSGSLGGPNAGYADAFLAKYDESGALLWTQQLGTNRSDTSHSVAIDASGNAYISGSTTGSLGGPNAGYADAFLAKYDESGALLWTQQLGTNRSDTSHSVAIDASGNAYISGSTTGSLGGPNAGIWDAFLAKYDDSGALLWTRQLGTSGYDYSYSVAIDGSGNAYISGDTSGSLGGPNAGYNDAFLAKYDGSGALLWTQQLGTSSSDYSFSVAIDGSGNAYISGGTRGDLGGPNAGDNDAFLAKYDESGALLWTRQLGTGSSDISYSVAIDGSGNAYISGYTYGSLGGPYAGSRDAFLAKYDTSGALLWTRQLGTSGWDVSYSVAIDGSGNAYISGRTGGDALLAKYVPGTPPPPPLQVTANLKLRKSSPADLSTASIASGAGGAGFNISNGTWPNAVEIIGSRNDPKGNYAAYDGAQHEVDNIFPLDSDKSYQGQASMLGYGQPRPELDLISFVPFLNVVDNWTDYIGRQPLPQDIRTREIKTKLLGTLHVNDPGGADEVTFEVQVGWNTYAKGWADMIGIKVRKASFDIATLSLGGAATPFLEMLIQTAAQNLGEALIQDAAALAMDSRFIAECRADYIIGYGGIYKSDGFGTGTHEWQNLTDSWQNTGVRLTFTITVPTGEDIPLEVELITSAATAGFAAAEARIDAFWMKFHPVGRPTSEDFILGNPDPVPWDYGTLDIRYRYSSRSTLWCQSPNDILYLGEIAIRDTMAGLNSEDGAPLLFIETASPAGTLIPISIPEFGDTLSIPLDVLVSGVPGEFDDITVVVCLMNELGENEVIEFTPAQMREFEFLLVPESEDGYNFHSGVFEVVFNLEQFSAGSAFLIIGVNKESDNPDFKASLVVHDVYLSEITPIPEPGTIAMIAMGAISLLGVIRHRYLRN